MIIPFLTMVPTKNAHVCSANYPVTECKSALVETFACAQVEVLELPYTDDTKSLLLVLSTDGDNSRLVDKVRKLNLASIRNDGVLRKNGVSVISKMAFQL